MIPSKLVVTRGLPGCGKTTYAKFWVAQAPEFRARINRDSLRAMMHDSVYVPGSGVNPGTEAAVKQAQKAVIIRLLNCGTSVIIDDTNLPLKTVAMFYDLSLFCEADFEIVDMTNVPLHMCLQRNAAREKEIQVPSSVIEEMYLNFVQDNPYPLPLSVDDTRIPVTAMTWDPNQPEGTWW